MKRLTILTCCLCSLLSFNLLTAQTTASTVGAFDEPIERELSFEADKKADKIPEYYRHFRKLSNTYKGYLVRLTVSDLPLRRDYHLFKYFGNVHYERLESGQLAYYIKVNFSKKSKVKDFVKNIVSHNAPEAKVVEKRGL